VLKIKPAYYRPLCFAVGLHVVLLILLLVHWSSPSYRLNQPVMNATLVDSKPIDATMINAQALQAEMQKLNAKKMAEAHQQAEKLAALRAQRQQEEARLERIQQEAVKKLAEAKEAQKQAELKKAELKKAEIKQAEIKQAEIKQAELKQAELKKTQEKLQQKLLAQQLAEEAKALKAQAAREAKQRQAAAAAANRGLLDQYRAKIVRAIQINWHPLQQDAQRSCQFLVHLAPGGKVTGVDLVKTSGDTALDQSARLAIFKASPLPVPQEAALFDEFRQFRIKMTPEDIQGMG